MGRNELEVLRMISLKTLMISDPGEEERARLRFFGDGALESNIKQLLLALDHLNWIKSKRILSADDSVKPFIPTKLPPETATIMISVTNKLR